MSIRLPGVPAWRTRERAAPARVMDGDIDAPPPDDNPPSQPRADRPSPVRPVPTPAGVVRAATSPPTPTGGGLGPLFVNPDQR